MIDKGLDVSQGTEVAVLYLLGSKTKDILNPGVDRKTIAPGVGVNPGSESKRRRRDNACG
jgi:hypothetical protein